MIWYKPPVVNVGVYDVEIGTSANTSVPFKYQLNLTLLSVQFGAVLFGFCPRIEVFLKVIGVLVHPFVGAVILFSVMVTTLAMVETCVPIFEQKELEA